ncbi:Fis family transcriptional regulator [alpha proteobacterium AAP81b]|nr:Fis family transcriptional regulator [alpha proteobacterium AAP81b]
MPAPLKILVVEDDSAIRRLLRGALARGDYAVVEAGSVREALSALAIDKPDAVLLDLGLPDRDGIEAIGLLKAGGAAVLVVSARTDTAEKVAALDLGADDYLVKPFDTDELLARLRTALRHRLGARALSDRVEIGAIVIDLAHRRVTRAGAEVHLSPKEYGVLAELARFPDRVIRHTVILREVWGPAHEDALDYLRIVIRNLRQKLEDDPARPRLIRNEPGVGYRLQG